MIYASIGIQGSGKGTQGRILEENYGFSLHETGWALREIAKEDSELGREVKSLIEAWVLVPTKIIGEILKDVVAKNTAEHIIFDGFIRKIDQKELFDSVFDDYKVLYFDMPKEVAIERLTTRMYDPETGETFMAGTKTNPKTGAELEQRKDDNIESIEKRIDLFYTETMPAVEELRKEGKLIEVNALGTLEEVTNEIATKLNLK